MNWFSFMTDNQQRAFLPFGYNHCFLVDLPDRESELISPGYIFSCSCLISLGDRQVGGDHEKDVVMISQSIGTREESGCSSEPVGC